MYRKIFLYLIASILLPYYVFSATYYISPTGSDSANGQTDTTPWKTFSHTFSTMSGGDELILLDGTYSIANNTGCINFDNALSGQPPSGISKTQPTIIRAQNNWSATVDGTGDYLNYGVFLGRSTRSDDYIKIQGLRITGAGGVYIYNGDYNYIKECSVNPGGILIGSNDHLDSSDYNLIEDSWTWNELRGSTSSYEGRYNIWRRVVVRKDGAPSFPSISFTAYNSQNVLFQNCISVDAVNDTFGYGDFAMAQHNTGSNNWNNQNIQWLGCISINSDTENFHLEADNFLSPTLYMKDCVAVTINSVTAGININGDAGSIIENCTVWTSGQWVIGVTFGQDTVVDNILRSMVIKGSTSSYAVNRGNDVDYIDLFGTWTAGAYNLGTCVTGCLTSDPEINGLIYPVRIEAGSALSGTGYNSSDYGANVVKKIGATGAFYGDTDYNTVTNEDLWPFPNEAQIKTDMSVDSTRGFCAVGENLTDYIWGYLGNGGYPGPGTAPAVNAGTDQAVSIDSASISGTYTLEGGRTVASCTWSNDRGGSGTLTAVGGTITGTVTGLSSGVNVITITVTDSEAEEGSDSLNITYTPVVSTISTNSSNSAGCMIR